MSITIAPGVNSKSLQLGQGVVLRAAQVKDCTALKGTPASVSLPITWATYGASSSNPVLIDVDLGSLAAANALDAVRSIYIDNTFSPTPVYVFFPDTGFTVVCPAFAVCMSPVWSNALKAQIYAIGFFDFNLSGCTIQFSNMHVNAYNAIASGTDRLPPFVIRTYHSAPGGAPQAVWTFNNAIFGPVDGTGIQFIGCHGSLNPGPPNLTGVKVNGIACTSIINIAFGIKMNAIFRVNTNVSTPATVELTFAAATSNAVIEVFSSYNLTANGVAFNTQNVTGNAVANLTNQNRGIALACSNATLNGGSVLAGIGNANEDAGANTSSGYQQTNGSILNINCPAGNANNCLVCASFV